ADTQNHSKKDALNDPVIEPGKEVLFHDFCYAGNSHAPVTFNIVAADESACASASTSDKSAQLNIVNYTESQRFISASFFVKRASNQIECAATQMSVRFVLIYAREPVCQRNQECNVPCCRRKCLRRDTWGERDVINAFPLSDRNRSRDDVRL